MVAERVINDLSYSAEQCCAVKGSTVHCIAAHCSDVPCISNFTSKKRNLDIAKISLHYTTIHFNTLHYNKLLYTKIHFNTL